MPQIVHYAIYVADVQIDLRVGGLGQFHAVAQNMHDVITERGVFTTHSAAQEYGDWLMVAWNWTHVVVIVPVYGADTVKIPLSLWLTTDNKIGTPAAPKADQPYTAGY